MHALEIDESSKALSASCLMLIDFQRDFLEPGGKMPVARNQMVPVIGAAASAIAQARHAGSPIVAVGNAFRPQDRLMNLLRRHASIAGTRGADWDERLPIEGITYFDKWQTSAFVNTAVRTWLNDHNIKTITLAGLFAKACVSATARAAMAEGFEVQILTGAVACSSDRSRAKALHRLARRGATLV